MLSFFESVLEFFELIFDIVLNFFNSLLTLLTVIMSAIRIPTYLTTFVHPLLSACILAVLLISIIKLILGWGNN